jgi:hypothetical protein
MAKKSMVNRETRRTRLVSRYAAKRAELKAIITNPDVSFEVQQDAIFPAAEAAAGFEPVAAAQPLRHFRASAWFLPQVRAWPQQAAGSRDAR